jgi:hypothetical protein
MFKEHRDEPRVMFDAKFAEIGQAARTPQPSNHIRVSRTVAYREIIAKRAQNGKVNGLCRWPQNNLLGKDLKRRNERFDAIKVEVVVAPIEMINRGETVVFNPLNFDIAQSCAVAVRKHPECPVALMPPSPARNLCDFWNCEAALFLAIKF